MKVSAEFIDGSCVLNIVPSDEWEQKLLGAIAKGGDVLQAEVTYKPEGHFSYGKASAVKVSLRTAGQREKKA